MTRKASKGGKAKRMTASGRAAPSPARAPSGTTLHARLKARHRAERSAYPKALDMRVHRALSWLDRAEQLAAQGDRDGQFIFLWIAFNAAYATELDDYHRNSAQVASQAFLRRLVELDGARGARLADMVWREFSGSLRTLLDNPYVYRGFWEWQRGTLEEEAWQRQFTTARRAANRALERRETATVLGIALKRIYVLRNQLIHGGATWGGKVNREQLRDCSRFMASLVPLVIEMLMDHPHLDWGTACYPVIEQGIRPPSSAT